MRDWQIGFSKDGPVYIIEEGPWWAFFVEWLADGPLSCGHIPQIPFPNIGKFKDINEETGKVEAVYTAREWYGTLSAWWHVHVDAHLTDFWWKHMKQFPSIDLSIEKLKDAHPKDYERYLMFEKEME